VPDASSGGRASFAVPLRQVGDSDSFGQPGLLLLVCVQLFAFVVVSTSDEETLPETIFGCKAVFAVVTR
jgi:hypothetical protein